MPTNDHTNHFHPTDYLSDFSHLSKKNSLIGRERITTTGNRRKKKKKMTDLRLLFITNLIFFNVNSTNVFFFFLTNDIYVTFQKHCYHFD